MTVERFSVYKCHFREDVAQHSYLTALYAMILADLERQRGREVDVEKLLRMALLHDAEESTTGDIHHPFKHQDEAFTKTIDDRALQWFRNLMRSLPDTLARDYIEVRKAEQGYSTEALLVRAADKLEPSFGHTKNTFLETNMSVTQELLRTYCRNSTEFNFHL